MAEFLLKPNDFQGQIDDFISATESVAALKYAVEEGGVKLQSIDKYMECVTAMNELIKSFSEFASLDGQTMQEIKAKWMNTDGEIATKTLAEIFGDMIKGES